MNASERVLVYGATGHTGRFVVDELLRRGLTPVLAGRSAERLAAVASRHAALDHRAVGLDDPDLLRRTVAGAGAVVNCAGPFLDTAVPLARAAVETGAHYLDVTAEQPVVQELYRELDAPARDAGVAVVPAMAFYGGLADLLVTDALDGDVHADAVEVAIGLDRWWPTAGTRATGVRNTATRLVIRDGALTALTSPAPTGTWSYPAPLGDQAVVQQPFSEVITDRPPSRRRRAPVLPQHRPARRPPRLRDPTTVRGRPDADARRSSSSSTSSYAVAPTPDASAPPAATSTPSPRRSSSKARSDSSTGATAAPVPRHRERRSMPAPCSPHWSRDVDGFAVRRDWLSPRQPASSGP